MSNLSCDQPVLNLSDLNTISDYLNGLLFQPWEWIIYQVIWPLLIAFGVISNLLFLYTVIRAQLFRTTTYMYLTNLSIADIIALLLFGIPKIMIHHGSPLRSETHLLFYFSQISGYLFSSVYFVTLVSFDRFLAVCYPIKHRIIKGTKRTIKLIII